MPKILFINICFRIAAFSLMVIAASGCRAQPNLKIPANPPGIIKAYKHVVLAGGTSMMKDTGVRIEEGDIYTVLVTGSINYCPRGGCKNRIVKPELGWPFIARVGDPDASGYFRPINRYDNTNHFTRTQYNNSGNLYVGYRQGPVDTNGNALRPQYYTDDKGAFSIDIIVWQTDDWVRMANFLEEQLKANPENVALKGAYNEASQFRKIILARMETTRALTETKKQIETIEQKTTKDTTSGVIADPVHTTVALNAAGRDKVAELEAQLQKLAEKLAGLDDMNRQLNAERKRSEKLAAELGEYEEREKELRIQLEESPRAGPVIVIANPGNQARTESKRINLSGVVQDDKGIASFTILINGRKVGTGYDRGIAVSRAAPARRVDFSDLVALQMGANTIQLRAVDTDGIVTTKALVVHRLEIKRNVWAIVIGINTYINVANLSYAVNDAQGFYRILVEKNRVPAENITLLLNKKANLNRLRSVLGTQLKKKAGKEDMVIIYFAGHGATEKDTLSPDGDGLEKYLLPVDADPDDLYASALPMRELSHIFNRLRSDRLIFIADACYSGATGGRTIRVAGGLRAVISDNFLDRISSGKGRVILTASGANEVSAEKPELKHGIFTYFLIKGLEGEADADRDGLITVDEIYNYVSIKVPQVTGQGQHPVKKGTVEGRLVLGVSH